MEKETAIIFDYDHRFIRLAIEEARQARESGDEPFGAVLVKDGKLRASGRNQVFTRNDPTYHAELGLIRDFCREKKVSDLSGYTLYSSCEPCVMCAGAIFYANISRLVYSVTLEELFPLYGGGIKISSRELFRRSSNPIEITGGVLAEEGAQIFEGYEWKRSGG
jgi:tRNA(Arg) A34 adenosine deaminase TadA